MDSLKNPAAAGGVTHNDLANAIRALSMDAVEAAKSGHPGMPMGMADVATVLFTRFLKYDPAWAKWPDRDRFVLSAGHGSMLLYSLLWLTGYPDISLDDIKTFRQWGSPCAGHPEHGHLAGIETTTGPLGQGIATAVGMALAERLQAARFPDVVDHFTYVIAGDGCLMEGISQEAISLAGHLNLSKLIVLWDDNRISIDGPTDLTVSDDMQIRFRASQWDVQTVDGHDPAQIAQAIAAAQASDRPSLIACRTIIGYGAPTKSNSAGVHGSPLGAEEITGARAKLGWPYAPFEIPAGILAVWREAGSRGAAAAADWRARFEALPTGVKTELTRQLQGKLPANFADVMADYKDALCAERPKIATRVSSQRALEIINDALSETIGGSADLTGSNNTKTKALAPVTPTDFSGRYVYYGVREHGMAAAMNGIALHGGFIPYGGTFLVFTDYCRPAIRLSALMKQRVVYVMTHDSIGLGEDGPTHQPVEHLASLRAIPNLLVFRPADAVEAAECWQAALESTGAPSILALSRQNLPTVREQPERENLSARGAYELRPAPHDLNGGKAQVTLIATGSEIEIAIAAQAKLHDAGVPARVVSMPCWELFEQQPAEYQDQILGHGTLKVAIEAGIAQGWDRYIGRAGLFVGMDGFGASAPAPVLYEKFGITADAVTQKVLNALKTQPAKA